jgi:hypothetical protein
MHGLHEYSWQPLPVARMSRRPLPLWQRPAQGAPPWWGRVTMMTMMAPPMMMMMTTMTMRVRVEALAE